MKKSKLRLMLGEIILLQMKNGKKKPKILVHKIVFCSILFYAVLITTSVHQIHLVQLDQNH